jgi:hypothetical protein
MARSIRGWCRCPVTWDLRFSGRKQGGLWFSGLWRREVITNNSKTRISSIYSEDENNAFLRNISITYRLDDVVTHKTTFQKKCHYFNSLFKKKLGGCYFSREIYTVSNKTCVTLSSTVVSIQLGSLCNSDNVRFEEQENWDLQQNDTDRNVIHLQLFV